MPRKVRAILRPSLMGICFIGLMTQAAYVMKVKDNKILINMEGQDAQVGQVYYIMDLSARKRGLTKILKAKNQKAIGRFVGEAEPGWDLVLKTSQARGRSEFSV